MKIKYVIMSLILFAILTYLLFLYLSSIFIKHPESEKGFERVEAYLSTEYGRDSALVLRCAKHYNILYDSFDCLLAIREDNYFKPSVEVKIYNYNYTFPEITYPIMYLLKFAMEHTRLKVLGARNASAQPRSACNIGRNCRISEPFVPPKSGTGMQIWLLDWEISVSSEMTKFSFVAREYGNLNLKNIPDGSIAEEIAKQEYTKFKKLGENLLKILDDVEGSQENTK